jgi:hypothetical protein
MDHPGYVKGSGQGVKPEDPAVLLTPNGIRVLFGLDAPGGSVVIPEQGIYLMLRGN